MVKGSKATLPPIFFSLRPAKHPWGDYGSILTHGMVLKEDPDGTIRLARTGPFVPPLTFPTWMALIVTDAMRQQLLASDLAGSAFVPVVKERIVRLNVETWDKSAARPPKLPRGGEPENYLSGRHNSEASEQMGDLLELRPTSRLDFIQCGTERRFGSDNWPILRCDPSQWKGQDFFRGQHGSMVFVTERAKAWIEQNAPGCLDFIEEQWA